MKRPYTIFVLCFTISLFSFAQTELWRLDGLYESAVRDVHGKIYLTSQETLFKIEPNNGTIEWEQKLNDVPLQMISAGSGVYLIFFDSVAYFDTLGTYQWKKRNPLVECKAHLDKSGNLFAVVQPTSGSRILIKLDTTGTTKFQVPIPSITIDGIEDQWLHGLYVDNNGNVLVLTGILTYFEKETDKGSTYARYQYIFGWKFNGSNGQVLNPKNKPFTILKKSLTHLEKSNSTLENFDSEQELNGYGFANGKFIMAGQYTHNREKATTSKESYENISEWRIITIDQNGKSKMKKYKGKGLDVCKDEGFSRKSDMHLNIFYDLVIAKDDTVYLSGTVASGKSNCGEPELHQDGVLMKYNAAKNKIIWVKTFAYEGGGSLILTPSQKVLLQVGANTIKVYDGDGNLLKSERWPDFIWIPGDIRNINTEDGVLYLNMYGEGGHYFAKYLLPPLDIIPGTVPVPYTEDAPYKFALDQNYPNPFNPQTTIRFTLPAQSMVTLKVFNMLGQEVATVLDNEEMEEGEQEIEFNAQNIASGVYFYRLEAKSVEDEETKDSKQYVSIRKMMLVR